MECSINARPLDSVNISTILHRVGKKRIQLQDSVLVYITSELQQQGFAKMQAQNISNSLYGLQRLNDSRAARDLLAELSIKVQECTEEFDGQAVGNALYGLHRLPVSQELLKLVDVLTVQVQKSRRELKAQEVSHAS